MVAASKHRPRQEHTETKQMEDDLLDAAGIGDVAELRRLVDRGANPCELHSFFTAAPLHWQSNIL